MAKVSVEKRGKLYQYRFAIAPQNGKRRSVSKSGFKTKPEAEKEGIKAYNEYLNTGQNFTPGKMSYSDYLDYWVDQHCKINLRYSTIESYLVIINKHIKPNLGQYWITQLTSSLIQEFINKTFVTKGFTKAYLKSIMKVVTGSLNYAADVVEFIKVNPSLKVKLVLV